MQVTVITPIAPHHQELFVRCADSVRRQTVEVRHLHMVDTGKRGPGYIRNKLLEQVKTKYVVFLDADDYLEPNFIERCLEHNDPAYYVYTNWMEGATEKSTPEGAFWDTAWHLITCLIHTDMMRIVGGFDEKLIAMEDTDLFLKFDKYAYCGICVPEPLVHYTGAGQRSSYARDKGLNKDIKLQLFGRYRVGCCNNPNEIKRPPTGTKLSNDVLAQALWEGNRKYTGAVTGRQYPRVSLPMKIWMDIRDARARADLFRILPPKDDPKKIVRRPAPKPVVLKRPRSLADMLHAAGMLEYEGEDPTFIPSLAASDIKPDYAKLNELAMRIYNDDGNKDRNIKPSIRTDSSAVGVKLPGLDKSSAASAARSQPS